MNLDTPSANVRSRRWPFSIRDDLALISAYAVTGSVLGPTATANAFAWSTASLRQQQPSFWPFALVVSLACALAGVGVRRSQQGVLAVLLVAGGVPAALALAVALVRVTGLVLESGLLTLLAWGWIAVLFDLVRSIYHALPLALLLALVGLCDLLVGNRADDRTSLGLRRRRPLLFSLTSSAAWLEYGHRPAFSDGPSSCALQLILASLAAGSLLLDLLAWHRTRRARSLASPGRRAATLFALLPALLVASAFTLFFVR